MKTVLIVDDNQENLYMLQVLLSANGFRVEMASNGTEALELAQSKTPDMIVSDILMPVMDGFALCRACKEDERLRDIPFVFYTATYTDPRDEDFALSLGADRFIIKPAEPVKLMAILREIMDNCKSRNPAGSNGPVEEAKYYKNYSEALIRKLEDKMLQLEEANRNLERDIAERRLVEKELKKSQRLLTETQKIGHTGGWEFNIDNEKQIWTEETYNIHEVELDYEPTVAKGINFYTTASRPVIEHAVKEVVEKGEPFDLELEIVTARGNLRSVHAIGKPDLEHRRVYGFIQDITGRRKAEEEKGKLQEQMIQAQKMESIGRLAGGVAHDINNMLGVILGFAELAMLETDPAHDLHEHIKQILKATRRSAELTRQLLAFARRQPARRKVLMLNDTIAGTLRMLQRIIGEDIELIWNPGESLWPIRMDQGQVDQILANLCVNARDAISGTGRIVIETDNIVFNKASYSHHDEIKAGEYIKLSFQDNGCGMDKETLSHLFEPFFTTKAIGKGTGLGLATVYGIVKQNEGNINVISELNDGTKFEFYFPRHTACAEQEGTSEPVVPAIRGRETLLLVEDEAQLSKSIQMMLESLGYRVLNGATPGEAIEVAKKHADRIDLLLTDLIMPEMNGKELAAEIQKFAPNIRLLFMSGYTTDVLDSRGFLEEGINFIQKPYSINELAGKLRELLD